MMMMRQQQAMQQQQQQNSDAPLSADEFKAMQERLAQVKRKREEEAGGDT